MSKKFYTPFIIFLSISFGFFLGRIVYKSNNIFYRQNRDFKKLEKLINIIEEYYPDKFNIFDYLHESLIKKIRTFDPYFAAFNENSYKNFSAEINGEFNGFGISYFSYQDTIFVSKIFKNSPAEQVNLRKLDRIIAVNDSNICNIPLDSVSEIFAKINKAKLCILPFFSDSSKTIFLNKTKVKLNPIHYFYAGNNTAFIKIDEFNQNTYYFFDKAITNLISQNKIENVILDLRNNPGGILTSAVKVADEFLDSNAIITQTLTKQGRKKIYRASAKGKFKNVNLIVLINMQTASAAELVTLAFQDNDRALIIGYRSYGKGVFQQDFAPLSNDFYHITTGKYFGPSGRNINVINRYENPDKKENFETQKGRIVFAENAISPEIYCSYFQYITTNTIALDFITQHKFLFDTINHISSLEKIAKNYLDTTTCQIEFYGLKPVNMLAYSFADYLLDDSICFQYITELDSCFMRAQSIIDSNLVDSLIFKKDTIY
jgi:carboxyl-terminal processing protease